MSDVENDSASVRQHHGELAAEMDRISLEQALKDVEIANARVTDLTQQVIALEAALAAANNDLRLLGGVNRTRVFSKVRTAAHLYARWKARR